jgi:hypothetical protein
MEIEKAVRREADIRLKITDFLGKISENLVMVKKAVRELGLYMALEKRSQRRIKVGSGGSIGLIIFDRFVFIKLKRATIKDCPYCSRGNPLWLPFLQNLKKIMVR